jgi:hypothetical protein
MSNEAREFAVARFNELETAKGELVQTKQQLEKAQSSALPQGWYEHEHAYVLSPEFAQVNQEINNLNTHLRHYVAQLTKIKNQEQWQDIQMDPQGNTTLVTKEADAVSDVEITNRMAALNSHIQQRRDYLQSVQANFKQGVAQAKGAIAQVENTYFPQYADPKVLEKNEHAGVMRKVLESRGLNNNLIANLFVKNYAFTNDLITEVDKLKAENKRLNSLVELAKKAEPAGGKVIAGGGAKPKPAGTYYDAAGFDKINQSVR